mgnify:CR=1 FL=1
MVFVIGSVTKMTSQYLENHKKELEALAAHYEKHGTPAFLYRAKCIRDLIKQENLKKE